MRRLLILAALVVSPTPWLLAEPARQAAPAQQMLTVDSIMRGPALLGASPSGVRWSKDSSTIYFNWHRADEEDGATWAVNRYGTGLRQLSDD